MKFLYQTSRNHKRTHKLFVLYLLILTGLFSTAVTGCANKEPEPVAAARNEVVITGEATRNSLQPLSTITRQELADPTYTAVPTIPATLTPLPTASLKTTPTAEVSVDNATSTPEDSVGQNIDSIESKPFPPEGSPTPTKPPPLPTPSGVYSWTLKVPILMYHYISEPPEDADKYRKDLSVTPEDFEEQMAYLVKKGFESVDLYDLSLAITNKRDLPEKPVVITLDDGYVDNYTNAFPILEEKGLEATFFVVTDFIDEGREGYLSWDMVKEMADAGMRIEPHSKTHPDLSEAERDYVIYEILGSQETIAAHIGHTPRYFCYPGGRYNEETIEILNELNFWGAVTTADGPWHGFNDRFEWSRTRMRNTTALAEFADLVNPYDTVAGKPAN
jgi:peptidoglycan/xylan/chitin deacetylase (PgdA/CDA1 family)